MAREVERRHPRGVGLGAQRLRLILCLLIAFAAVLGLSSAQATGAKRDVRSCTWGASSIRAEVVDGKMVVSEPATSGCIP